MTADMVVVISSGWVLHIRNFMITRLKIARNPFAKGFREAGKCRSSLEAMMASFGVVIDSNKGHTPAVKRKYEDSGPDNPSSSSSPNFVHTFRPGLNGAAGHTVPVQLQNMFPTTGNVSFVPSSPSPLSLPFPVAQFTSPNTSAGLDSGKGVQLPFPYSLDLGHSPHQKDMQCQQLHSLPFCILPNAPFTEVHPAFRCQTNSQLDYNLLNSYYKTCSSYAALPHMLVPSYAGHTTQLFNGDIKKENIETNSGSAYKHESDGALNLCKT
ncbi:TBX15-like protein [Mya arenaria]|uniref:TBX15-like protein n=1 Tax=Mya arenaria TaxID=6604 RepID=A0ABY7EI21_MYAAR|nr:TBX15-like protein [Mya arenaria]